MILPSIANGLRHYTSPLPKLVRMLYQSYISLVDIGLKDIYTPLYRAFSLA